MVLETTWPDAHTKINFCGQRLGAAGTTDSCRQDHNYMMLQRGYLQPNGHHSLLWTRPQLYEVTERLFTAKWSPQFTMNKAIIIWSYIEVIHSQEIPTVCCEQCHNYTRWQRSIHSQEITKVCCEQGHNYMKSQRGYSHQRGKGSLFSTRTSFLE